MLFVAEGLRAHPNGRPRSPSLWLTYDELARLGRYSVCATLETGGQSSSPCQAHCRRPGRAEPCRIAYIHSVLHDKPPRGVWSLGRRRWGSHSRLLPGGARDRGIILGWGPLLRTARRATGLPPNVVHVVNYQGSSGFIQRRGLPGVAGVTRARGGPAGSGRVTGRPASRRCLRQRPRWVGPSRPGPS